MKALSLVVRSVIIMLLLPFVPTADDRIVAARVYESSLSPRELFVEQRDLRSVLARLRRAAHRQRVMNSIRGPEFEELQRRKWERGANYAFIIRRVAFWLSMAYGANCLSAELKLVSPGAAAALDSCAKAGIYLIDGFWGWVASLVPK